MPIFKPENLPPAGGCEPSIQRHTVMVVDDVRANAAVMAAILRPHFHLIEAHDGEEALALIAAMPAGQQLACIVSDHRMPGLSGVALLQHLLPILPDTRRILVTGYMDMDAIVAAINEAAIYRFIAKPFEADEFLLAVRCAVAAFEAERARAACEAALAAQLASMPEPVRALRLVADQAGARQAALEAQLRALAVD